MSLKNLTRQSVLKAIREFDRIGRENFLSIYGFGSAKEYWLIHDGRKYDSKAIMGVAHKYARPDLGPLKSNEFSGGAKTVKSKLEELNFTVWVKMTIVQLVEKLNEASRSGNFKFGTLQQIRMKNPDRIRVSASDPFVIKPDSKFIDEGYAYHYGGSDELQFNIGFENEVNFRWGVAISLLPSKTLTDVSVMFPKLDKLSEFIRIYGNELLSDFVMWHSSDKEGGNRSEDRLPEFVPQNLYSEGVFLFLGKHAPVEEINIDTVLGDFDRLLPLYEYVEFKDKSDFPILDDTTEFSFTPGVNLHRSRSNYTAEGRRQTGSIEIRLRHRKIQDSLMNQLISEMGEENVAREHPNGVGGYVDLITNQDNVLEFYEIKVGNSARACIREALGQLMEYGYWPSAAFPTKLYVAAEPKLDADAKQYLKVLRSKFQIPIYYRRVELQ